MSDSNSPNSSSPRPVLKLKTAASSSSDRAVRASRPRPATGPDPSPGVRQQPSHPVASTRAGRPQGKVNQKPGAAWSDELKRRMQEDMDALLTR
jgi:hypothetical protein